MPYAVKVHGSALEYTVRPQPERFLPYALEGIRGRRGVLVGSRHTAESLWEVTGEPGLRSARGWARRGWTSTPSGRVPADEAAAGLDGASRSGWEGATGRLGRRGGRRRGPALARPPHETGS